MVSSRLVHQRFLDAAVSKISNLYVVGGAPGFGIDALHHRLPLRGRLIGFSSG